MKFPLGFGAKTRPGKGKILGLIFSKKLKKIIIKTNKETTINIILNYLLFGVFSLSLYFIITSCDSSLGNSNDISLSL